MNDSIIPDGLRIDPEFRLRIPPLSDDEYELLENSIKAEGCREALIAWRENGLLLLLDGHNRLDICGELGIPFEIREISLPDREAALAWIDANQVGRRNLSDDNRRLVLGRVYNRQKAAHGGDRKSKAHFGPLISGSAAERLAAEHGVSRNTVKRAGEFARAVDELMLNEPEIVARGEAEILARAKELQRNRTPHVAKNTGDNEWYTPAHFIESARAVMGGIELDPASSPEANEVVKAETFFTAEQCGLEQDWRGKVWLNPPYATDLIGRFCEKLAESVETEAVTEAIVLVNNATETRWFARLCSVADGLCFPTGRVKFWHPRKEAVPLQGQAVLYVGEHWTQFALEFKQYGIVARIRR